MITRRIILITLCLSAVFGGFGCKKTKTEVDSATESGILLQGNGIDPADLDPQTALSSPEGRILSALFEGLVVPDPKNLTPQPGVAQAWKVSDDGLTYTFYLRPEARWSNGDAITADDFVFSMKRFLSPRLAAANASLLYVIEGAEAFHKGQTDDFSTVGVVALDEGTLQIQLKQPTAHFLPLLLHTSFYPVHQGTILKYGQIDQRGTPWTRAGNMVCNGPFVLKSWEMQKTLKVQRNPYYWDAEHVVLNEIHFFPMNGDTEERAFRAGQLHVTEGVPSTKHTELIKENSPELLQAPVLASACYILNTTRPPFNDLRVRKALNLALDREAIAQYVVGKGRLPAYAFTPPGTLGYTPEASVSKDLEEAKVLLKQAGYPDGKGFPVVSILYSDSQQQRILAEAIQQMWHDTLGITIELYAQEWKVYLNERKAKNFDILSYSWIGDYVDPSAFLGVFKSDSLHNYSGWMNAEFDHQLGIAAKQLDPQVRNQAFQKAEGCLVEDLPFVPIHYYNSAYLLNTSVEGWYPNVMDRHPYKYVRLVKKG